MKSKIKKTYIIILALCCVAFAALELYVQSDAFSLRIRQYVVGPLQDLLGPDAQIGFVKANFFPPYLEVHDIVLPDSRGNIVASIRRITVYINPLPLVVKKIWLPSISILEPRVHTERSVDGTLTLMPLVDRIKSNIARMSSRGPSEFGLQLRTISIYKGEILFQDDALSTKVAITDVNITSGVNLVGNKVRVNIRGARVRFTAPAYPELNGVLKASVDYDRGWVRLHSFELLTGDAACSFRGVVGPLPDATLDLRGKVRFGPQTISKFTDILKSTPKQRGSRVEASITARGKIIAPEILGDVSFSGLTYQGMTLQDAALSFQYRDHALSVGGDNWRVSWNKKTFLIDRITSSLAYRHGTLDIEHFEVIAGDLAVRMSGTLDPSTGFKTHLATESSGAGRTLSSIVPLPIEGAMKVEGNLTGALKTPVFDGSIDAGPLRVRGVHFSDIRGRLEYANNKIILSSVEIRRPSSHYVLDGSVDLINAELVYSARLRVIQSDVVSVLAMFHQDLPLRLSVSGELSFQGTARSYTGNGSLFFGEGSAYGESFTHGSVTALLSTGKISFPQVVLYKKHGLVEGTGWIAFDGSYSAALACRELSLAMIDHLDGIPVAGSVTLDIRSSGSFSDPAVKATLDIENLSYHEIVVGQVHGDAEIKDGKLKMTAALSEETAEISLSWLLRKPYPWAAQARIKSDSLNLVRLLAKKDVSDRVQVIVEGSVTARGSGPNLSTMSGEFVFPRISVIIGEYRIENEPQSLFTIENGRLSIKSLNFAGPGTRISVTGSTKVFADVDTAITGDANLSLLKLLFPEIEYAAGTAEMKLTLKDDWSNPDVVGELRIHNGEIRVRDIPQKFIALNGKFTLNQGRVVTDSLSGEMGGGTLGVSGQAQLSGVGLQDFSVKTTFGNVTVRYPEGLTSTLSGDLFYDGSAKEQTLSGDVLIKRARYDKTIEWKSMLVDLSRRLYQKKKADIGWIGNTQINVRFHGSDNILFQNNLAKMPLDIDVILRGTVNQPQLLGRIEARTGSFFFRNNDFKILSASVDFIDPNRMNPILDIQAETQVREYKIGLAVTGAADRAVVTLISEPALSDSDILSLLAVGRKSSELQGKETNVGVGEAASFATGQFQDFFSRRARSLTGLDRFQVDPYISKNDTSVPRLTVGKELVQDKVFLTYSSNVGASTPEQVFRIEYVLNKHFSLIGELGELGNTGADIKYRFEFP